MFMVPKIYPNDLASYFTCRECFFASKGVIKNEAIATSAPTANVQGSLPKNMPNTAAVINKKPIHCTSIMLIQAALSLLVFVFPAKMLKIFLSCFFMFVEPNSFSMSKKPAAMNVAKKRASPASFCRIKAEASQKNMKRIRKLKR